MFKWASRLFRKKEVTGPRHVSELTPEEVRALHKFNFRVTGKLVWSDPVRAQKLDKLAQESFKTRKIVAYGDITVREIPETAFVAFYRDYYTE